MFTRAKVFVYLLFGGILSAQSAAWATDLIQLASEENPPFNYTDEKTGEFVGVGTGLVKELFKRADMKYEITSGPWARSYNNALNNKNTCVFMTAITDERKPLFKWVGPFLKVEWVIYAKANSPLKISSIEDLRKLRVGGYIEDAPVTFLQKQGIEFDLVPRDELNPKKLELNRIDVWVTNNVRGPLLAEKAGVTNMKKVYAFKDINHYLACNKKMPDEVINRLNSELAQMKSKGDFDKIVKVTESYKVRVSE